MLQKNTQKCKFIRSSLDIEPTVLLGSKFRSKLQFHSGIHSTLMIPCMMIYSTQGSSKLSTSFCSYYQLVLPKSSMEKEIIFFLARSKSTNTIIAISNHQSDTYTKSFTEKYQISNVPLSTTHTQSLELSTTKIGFLGSRLKMIDYLEENLTNPKHD